MSGIVPAGSEFSRKALERIIQRAAELQAGERQTGDALSEREVMELGREVGLPARFVQQAMLEELTRVDTEDPTWITRFVGPAYVAAHRTIPGNRGDLEAALAHWMTEEELLTVKRRFKQQTSWEPRRDFFASLKRGLGLSGRRYVLSRTKEVAGEVLQLEDGWCHVSLRADLTNTRREHLGGAAALSSAGAGMTVIALVLSVAVPVALIPAAAGLAGAAAVARSRVATVERVTVALEQILDRLEHGEARPPAPQPQLAPGREITKMIRDELRRHLT
jgi:hypothetical protein